MNTPFEAKGFWWLPETPENTISGTLSFSPGQPLHLELMGALNQITSNQFPHPKTINPPIIQGKFSDGRFVTLQNCLQTQTKFNLSGTSSTSFICHLAFIGVHFTSDDLVKFKGIDVYFNNLDEWFSKSGFDIQEPETGSVVITYKQPSQITTLVNDFHVDFECYPIRKYSNNLRVNISQEARIHIWSETEKIIEDFFPILRLLQYFLTLAMAGPTFVTKVVGRIDSSKQEGLDPDYPLLIEIYYPAAGWQADKLEIDWFEMLFTLPAIEDHLEIFLNNWINKAEIIRPAYDLYFSTIYSHTFPEFELLSLTQAIETYHRNIYGGTYQSDDEYHKGLFRIFLDVIPDDVAGDFKSALKKGKLYYANEYSFRKRLLLLGAHLENNMKINFLSDKKSQGIFAEKVADTRNYFTHYSPELKAKAALRGEELLDLRRKLRLILQICFLEQMGFSFDKITEMFKKSREYRQYII